MTVLVHAVGVALMPLKLTVPAVPKCVPSTVMLVPGTAALTVAPPASV